MSLRELRANEALKPTPALCKPGANCTTVFCLISLLGAHAIFLLLSLPEPRPQGVYFLTMTPTIAESVKYLLSQHWTSLLFPYQYEPGRYYWATTVVPFTYFVESYLGGVGSYLFFSSLLTAVSFVLARAITGSLLFASTLAYMLAFGTQLDYQFTYGNLVALYLVLSYAAVNFAIAVLIVNGRLRGVRAWVAFLISLAVLAVSNEMWINYATALIAAAAFGVLWASCQDNREIRIRCGILLLCTIAVLGAYLLIRLRLVHQYVAPGAEEELLVTYAYKTLLVEDAVANFFTLLYMTLSNYLPAFLTSSNSLTYLDKAAILAEQHGYDPGQQNLIIFNHLFLWRFYAGALVTIFVAFVGWLLVRAFRSSSLVPAILAALSLMVLAGFSTHLSIKMRPYNVVPALPYKAIFSIGAFTVLASYLTTLGWQHLSSTVSKSAVVIGVWCSVFLAALTRPAMHARLLGEVGLLGFGDPLGQLLHWFR